MRALNFDVAPEAEQGEDQLCFAAEIDCCTMYSGWFFNETDTFSCIYILETIWFILQKKKLVKTRIKE